MQEFIYYNKEGLDFPVDETIFVSSNLDELKDKNFLISNTNSVNCEYIAKEIDFYIRNSQDTLSKKIQNVSKLYEIAATKFDFASDVSFSLDVSNDLLLVTNSKEEYDSFVKNISKDDFNLYHVDSSIVKDIFGTIGNLSVIVDDEGNDVTLNISQVVYFNAPLKFSKHNGCYDPLNLSIEEIINQLNSNIQAYSYKKFLNYDQNICQYHERREEICSRCEMVCPTVAITKDDKTKRLIFSHSDCIGCGDCVSICPSGSLDYSPLSKEAIYEISNFYKDSHILIIPQKMDIDNINIELKENILPLYIEGEKFLNEATLLTLLQGSSSQIIFYCDDINEASKDSIRILNDIYQLKYSKNAVLVAKDLQELKIALQEVSFVEDSYYNFNQNGLKKREIFSYRLNKLVGEDNLGVVKTGDFVHYGKVEVNEANCTLCLSCVGACNVDALIANESDFTLRINPSLCTACGYCEISCPEKDCLSIKKDVIELEPNWFKENVLAKDKLFACVECGKEFATTKAIEKIANMMAPIFAKVSETKKRTLYCCEDCKAKLMIKEGLLNA